MRERVFRDDQEGQACDNQAYISWWSKAGQPRRLSSPKPPKAVAGYVGLMGLGCLLHSEVLTMGTSNILTRRSRPSGVRRALL